MSQFRWRMLIFGDFDYCRMLILVVLIGGECWSVRISGAFLSTVDQSGSVTLASGPSASFGQSGFGQTSSGSSQTGGGRNNQSVTPQASTFVSPQANNVFASSPVYYTSAPHTVAFPQGFSASGSPYAQSIVHSNKPLSSPVYTQYVASSPSPYAHHSAMMQSSPTGAAQLHIATPEAVCK
ncbi:hypothetical protein V6N11_019818 [Hibiscus sabdariffa]|uniref:Uncharacterized protein n=1 Tax=Hibiscus sabdariffa TaxID=183260 RepID=A0ABR1ZAD7_9ROSI